MTSLALQRLGVGSWLRRRVALRIGQEDLDAVGVHLRRPAAVRARCRGQSGADMYADRVYGHAERP